MNQEVEPVTIRYYGTEIKSYFPASVCIATPNTSVDGQALSSAQIPIKTLITTQNGSGKWLKRFRVLKNKPQTVRFILVMLVTFILFMFLIYGGVR